jgi:hypothetical protein
MTAPFRADGGLQLAGQANWPGPSNVAGWYYKTGFGWLFRNNDNNEYGIPYTLYKNAISVSSVTSGEIDAQSYTMPANTLTVDGQQIVFDMGFTHAANTNTATYKFYVNGTQLAGQNVAGSSQQSTNRWTCTRMSSSTLRCTGLISNASTLSTAITTISSVNFAASIIVKTAVLGATANGDMVANYLRGELWP